MQTQPIGVACPRCADDIMCTVEVKLLTGHRTEMRLVDLADRFAEHYVAAGHAAPTPTGRWFGPVLDPQPVGVHFVDPWVLNA